MPNLSNSTITIQDILHYAQSFADLVPVLPTSGWAHEPALSIANDVMKYLLAKPLNWKWNRAYVTPFPTVSLQQDYVCVQKLANGIVMPDQNWVGAVAQQQGVGASVGSGAILDMGWLTGATRVDINNTAYPQPRAYMEAVRDLQATYTQLTPFQISWIPTPHAIYGTWLPNTKYANGVGATQAPLSPIQQIIDPSGNYLYVSQYGTTGSTVPDAGSNATPGNTVSDGSVQWTVADPRGVALRLAPVPPAGGITWMIYASYQMKAPRITSLTQTWEPVPDDLDYVLRQGFVAGCKGHKANGTKDDIASLQKWQAALITSMQAADRETESFGFYPSSPIGGPVTSGLAYGPSNPYGYGYF